MVQSEVIFKLEGIGEEAVWSPGDCPLGGHGGAGCQCLLDDGVVNRVAIEQGCVWSQDLPMELGAEDCSLDLFWVVIPVPNQDKLPCGF